MSNKFSSGIRVWNQRAKIVIQGLQQVLLYSGVITLAWCLYRIYSTFDWNWKVFYYWYVEWKVLYKTWIGNVFNQENLRVEFYNLSTNPKELRSVRLAEYSHWFWNQSLSGKKVLKLLFWFEKKAISELLKIFLGSIVSGVGIFSFYGYKLFSKVKKGIELVSLKSLQRSMSKEVKKNSFKIDKLKLPECVERQHFLVTGTTGTGKTNFLKYVVKEIRKRKEQAVIFDLTGELKTAFGRDGDIEINPYQSELSQHWSPWHEFDSGNKNLEIVNIVKSLIPESGYKGKDFFNEAGRTVLEEIFKKAKNIEDLRKIFSEDFEKIYAGLKGSLAAGLINPGSKETGGSVLATVVNALKQLDPIGSKHSGKDFSIKQWIKEEKKNWLFFSVKSSQRNSLRSLLCIWADICIRAIMEKEVSQEISNTWLIMDELAAFGNVPSLSTGLAELRKYGGCVVGSIQNIAQLRSIYGYDDAQALMDLFSSKFVFRSGEFEIAKYFSDLLGRENTTEKKESISLGGENKRDSIHIGENNTQDPVVSPSNILYLPDRTCYLRIAGDYPVSKMNFKIYPK